MVLAADVRNHRTSVRRRIPGRALVDRCRRSWRVLTVEVRLWAARPVLVRNYRPIPRLLVQPFQGLHVLGERRNSGRPPPLVGVRWVFRRVGSEGTRDGCDDDARSHPLCDGRRCGLGNASQTAYGRPSDMDAIPMLWTACDRHWRTNRPNAQISPANSAFSYVTCTRRLPVHRPLGELRTP